MIASSVACIVALIVSTLGLARALFDVTWPLGESGVDQICLQIGRPGPDQPSAKLVSAAALPTSKSAHLAAAMIPTFTPAPPTVTPGSTSTSTLPPPTPLAPAPTVVVSVTIPITAQAVFSATTGYRLQAPILLNPEPYAQLQSEVHFQWQWDGQPLPEGLAFDLLIWSEAEDQEHQGAEAHGVVETDPSLERSVDLDYVEAIIEHGGGAYFWTVIVVQQEPYERVGTWGEKRPFTYVVPEPAAEPPTRSP